MCGARAFRVDGGLAGPQRVALSRDGQTLFVIAGARLCELDARDGLERRVLRSTAGFMSCVAVADDQTLLVATDQSLRWISRDADALVASRERTGIRVRAVAPSPTRARLCAVSAYGTPPSAGSVWLVDGDARAEAPAIRRCALPAGDELAQSLWFTSDGSELRVVTSRAIHRVDPRSGVAIGRPIDLSALLGARVVSALAIDDARMLLATSAPSLAILDLERAELVSQRAGFEADAWYLRAPLLAGPTRDDRALIVSDGAVRRIELRSLDTIDSALAVESPSAADVLRAALVDRAQDRAWLIDERGAIHRVDLGASLACTRTAACGAPSAAWFDGAQLRIERERSPIELVALDSGESRFEGASAEAIDEDERRLTVAIATRVWRFDAPSRTLRGPAVDVLIEGSKDALWLAVSPSERVAVVARFKELIVVDLVARSVRFRCKVAGEFGGALLSDDELALWGPRGIRWLSIGAASVDERARGPALAAVCVALSPDRARFVVASSTGALALVTRDRTWAIGDCEGGIAPTVIAWSEDHRHVALVGEGPTVTVLDVDACAAKREPSLNARGASKATRRTPSRRGAS